MPYANNNGYNNGYNNAYNNAHDNAYNNAHNNAHNIAHNNAHNNAHNDTNVDTDDNTDCDTIHIIDSNNIPSAWHITGHGATNRYNAHTNLTHLSDQGKPALAHFCGSNRCVCWLGPGTQHTPVPQPRCRCVKNQ